MTLCRHRPRRTYDAQYIFDKFDVDGLIKTTEIIVNDKCEDGEADAHDWAVVLATLNVMFGVEADSEIDTRLDFQHAIKNALEELNNY